MASGSNAVRRSRSTARPSGRSTAASRRNRFRSWSATANVAAAAPDERPADVAVQEDRLLRAMGFRHVEDEQVRIGVPVQLFLDVDHDAQLVGLAQRRQELALHLVHVQHADDLHLPAALSHAEDQVPTLGVGECGDRLVGVAGHAPSGFLELDVAPFVPAKAVRSTDPVSCRPPLRWAPSTSSAHSTRRQVVVAAPTDQGRRCVPVAWRTRRRQDMCGARTVPVGAAGSRPGG